ncbi:MAG: DsbA family oxidoreductase [Betaproteobacteria bacterium]|jgi:predicted DsbA family dithiol-disulfide isomerase|nr:DsbA family oxidoreductase [Betaproteobacteria bacterium]NBS46147.1 DsbA family oxidoreductase [Betaproteobacteria bacterium]
MTIHTATPPDASHPSGRPSLQIDFVSDVACPWCAVGLNALDQAIERLKDEVRVEMKFQPFELNPQMGPEGEDSAEHLKRKYGMSDSQLAAARDNLRRRGAEVGFPFGQRPRIWNTFDAHRLIHWAGLHGRQHAMKHALLKAYQADDRNPGERAVLIDCARQCGLDEQEAARVFDSGAYTAEVRQAQAMWREAGIHSVPSIVINGRHLIQGGQPVEVFEQALRQLAQAAPQA